MSGPRDLNSSLPTGKICNADGTATMQFAAFIRRVWERTGYSPGQDMSWLSDMVDKAVLAGAQAQTSALAAQSEAEQAQLSMLIRQQSALIAKQQSALDIATVALVRLQAREQHLQSELDAALLAVVRAQAAEQKASKALETAQDSAIISFTARRK